MASDDFRINGSELIKYSGRDSVVEIPQGVEVIGEGAFKGNMYLEEVIIPDSVTRIMREAFKNCKKLKKSWPRKRRHARRTKIKRNSL